MTRRTTAVTLAAAVIALTLALVAPQAQAVSFVDKQVQAGGLLLQNYINAYGMKHAFMFPPKSMVKKGGGLEDATRIWPSNPWTGRVMSSGTTRGKYTYRLRNGGTAYTLTMHLSKGRYAFKGSMPAWLKRERNTASMQGLLLLQRYVEAYAAANGGVYPASGQVAATTFTDPPYVWPVDPWTGSGMDQGTAVGEFSYTQLDGGAGYTLRVMLTGGWSSPALGPVSLLARLSAVPAG